MENKIKKIGVAAWLKAVNGNRLEQVVRKNIDARQALAWIDSVHGMLSIYAREAGDPARSVPTVSRSRSMYRIYPDGTKSYMFLDVGHPQCYIGDNVAYVIKTDIWGETDSRDERSIICGYVIRPMEGV